MKRIAACIGVAAMLGLLAVAVHRFGNPATILVGPIPSAIADAVSPR